MSPQQIPFFTELLQSSFVAKQKSHPKHREDDRSSSTNSKAELIIIPKLAKTRETTSTRHVRIVCPSVAEHWVEAVQYLYNFRRGYKSNGRWMASLCDKSTILIPFLLVPQTAFLLCKIPPCYNRLSTPQLGSRTLLLATLSSNLVYLGEMLPHGANVSALR